MLKIEHLTKLYPGSKKGVSDLSLHVAAGDLYAFIGHNLRIDTRAEAACAIEKRAYPKVGSQCFACGIVQPHLIVKNRECST